MVEYTYDTWGKLLSTTGSLSEIFGKEQPFRYRGYVYDEETGWYYIQSSAVTSPSDCNLTHVEARGLEQALIIRYKSLNTANKMNNQIDGISPRNPKFRYYMKVAFEIAEAIFSNGLLNIFVMQEKMPKKS